MALSALFHLRQQRAAAAFGPDADLGHGAFGVMIQGLGRISSTFLSHRNVGAVGADDGGGFGGGPLIAT